jgi:segregation and condensation protein B
MENIKLINALLFLKGRTGATIKDISSTLKISKKDAKVSIDELMIELQKSSSIYLIKVANDTYRLTLKHDIAKELSNNLDKTINIRLSKSVLETLTIIAYRQPITKPYIDDIRGVTSDYAIRRLLDFELIIDDGRADSIGQPKLYVTTNRFLELFDISNIDGLPTMNKTIVTDDEVMNLFEYD